MRGADALPGSKATPRAKGWCSCWCFGLARASHETDTAFARVFGLGAPRFAGVAQALLGCSTLLTLPVG